MRDMIAAFDADAGGVEAAAPAVTYSVMLGRYRYFELHMHNGDSTVIEKFANPVNGNLDVHNRYLDDRRYVAVLNRAWARGGACGGEKRRAA